MSDIAPTAQIIADRLGSVIDRAAIDIVLVTLLALKREYASDPLRFQEKHSAGQTRFGFDPRVLLFVADTPPAGSMRFEGSLGGRMS